MPPVICTSATKKVCSYAAPGKSDAAQGAHRAVGPVAAGDPGRRALALRPVGALEPHRDRLGRPRQAHELGVPAHRRPLLAQALAHEALVVVLAEDEDVRVRRRTLAGAAEQHATHVATARPDVGTRAALAELERALGDTELGVDLQSARLNPERARLLRGTRVVVDEQLRTPRRTSWFASISPVGPAPTIRTSVSARQAPRVPPGRTGRGAVSARARSARSSTEIAQY